MKHLFCILILFIASFECFAELEYLDPDKLDSLEMAIDRLDEVKLKRAGDYREMKIQRQKASGRDRVLAGERISRRYVAEDLDSAVLYMQLAYKDAVAAGLRHEKTRLMLGLYSLMPSIGMPKEAVENFLKIKYEDVDSDLRRDYWLAACEIYHTVQVPYPEGVYKEQYKNQARNAIDSLISYYQPDSPVALYLIAQRHLLRGERNLAVANFAEVIPLLEGHSELKDFAMKTIGDFYKTKPSHRRAYLNMLIHRVINNLTAGTVRPAALAELGEQLISEGYEKLGQRCISLALETSDHSYASFYSKFDRSEYIHYVTGEASRLRALKFFCGIALVVLCIAFSALYLRLRQRLNKATAECDCLSRRLSICTDQAARTNQNLIALAFLAMEHSKEYNVHVMRKLKAGQVKDLYADVETGKYIQTQKEKFFEVFDSTFLASYPDFVKQLNALIVEGREIPKPPADTLSPELRIAAFMKLGITDSNKLSQALGLSLNTIYTYRNRLRFRLIDKSTFERDLANIY
ncbi:MAG: hypothetical protein K2L28_00070 [Muribaculaceae bacterium]|nr:hypothetical protein [Muribaculaceae bacterium]